MKRKILVSELARNLGRSPDVVLRALDGLGMPAATVQQAIDLDLAMDVKRALEGGAASAPVAPPVARVAPSQVSPDFFSQAMRAAGVMPFGKPFGEPFGEPFGKPVGTSKAPPKKAPAKARPVSRPQAPSSQSQPITELPTPAAPSETAPPSLIPPGSPEFGDSLIPRLRDDCARLVLEVEALRTERDQALQRGVFMAETARDLEARLHECQMDCETLNQTVMELHEVSAAAASEALNLRQQVEAERNQLLIVNMQQASEYDRVLQASRIMEEALSNLSEERRRLGRVVEELAAERDRQDARIEKAERDLDAASEQERQDDVHLMVGRLQQRGLRGLDEMGSVLRVLLEAHTLDSVLPGLRVSTPVRLTEVLERRLCLTCGDRGCEAPEGVVAFRVAKARCELCGGRSASFVFRRFNDACLLSGITRVVLAGGSEQFHDWVRPGVDRRVQIRFLRANHPPEQVKGEIRWAQVAICWSGRSQDEAPPHGIHGLSTPVIRVETSVIGVALEQAAALLEQMDVHALPARDT